MSRPQSGICLEELHLGHRRRTAVARQMEVEDRRNHGHVSPELLPYRCVAQGPVEEDQSGIGAHGMSPGIEYPDTNPIFAWRSERGIAAGPRGILDDYGSVLSHSAAQRRSKAVHQLRAHEGSCRSPRGSSHTKIVGTGAGQRADNPSLLWACSGRGQSEIRGCRPGHIRRRQIAVRRHATQLRQRARRRETHPPGGQGLVAAEREAR